MSLYDEVDGYRHVTPDQLSACMPRCKSPTCWARSFDDAIERFGIDDVAMLMAQVGHESSDLTRLEESLWYRAERIMEVWPSRFPTLSDAEKVAGSPERLANQVYGHRMGNNQPGDGWLFHGRGPIQLTGRDNYMRFSCAVDIPSVMSDPDTLLEPNAGALAACWYYSTRVRAGANIRESTLDINGGLNGFADRKDRYERCKEVFNV